MLGFVIRLFRNFINKISAFKFESSMSLAGVFLISNYFIFTKFSLDSNYIHIHTEANNSIYQVVIGGVFLLIAAAHYFRKDAFLYEKRRVQRMGEISFKLQDASNRYNGAEIQRLFADEFGFEASVPLIKCIFSDNNPAKFARDCKLSRGVVAFSPEGFSFEKNAKLNIHCTKSICDIFYWLLFGLFFVINTFIQVMGLINWDVARQLMQFHIYSYALPVVGLMFLPSIAKYGAAIRLLEMPIVNLDDEDCVRSLLENIHTTSMDTFIEQGRIGYVYIPIIHFYEGVYALVRSSSFHIRGNRARLVIMGFFDALKDVVSHTSVHSYTRGKNMNGFIDNLRRDEFINKVDALSRAYSSFIQMVKADFPRISLNDTDKCAIEDYKLYYADKV